MKLGSKIVQSRKSEGRAGKLNRRFELGQKKTDIVLNKLRMGLGKAEPPSYCRP